VISIGSHYLASGGHDFTWRPWDLRHGWRNVQTVLSREGDVVSVTFAPDGTRLATGRDKLRVWKVRRGR